MDCSIIQRAANGFDCRISNADRYFSNRVGKTLWWKAQRRGADCNRDVDRQLDPHACIVNAGANVVFEFQPVISCVGLLN